MARASAGPAHLRILLLTPSLASGGAERQLTVLAKGLKRRGHDVVVAEFYGGGLFEAELSAAGVRLVDLKITKRWRYLTFFLRLVRLVKRERPDIIQSFSGVPNILALLSRWVSASSKVVWGVRASDVDLSWYGWASRASYRMECALALHADLIIANSKAGKSHAVQNGFPASKTIVIRNGIDMIHFRPDRVAGLSLRRTWGVPDGTPLVGLVGRLDPMKDHSTFIRAAARIRQAGRDVRFACVGRTGGPEFQRIERLSQELGIGVALTWAGEQSDMSAVYNSLDLLCLSSVSESFPNVVCEAMACGVPCVVTDVGDATDIVGQTGRVVPPRDAAALADAVMGLLDERRPLPEASLRRRIADHFSVDRLVDDTERELLDLRGIVR